MHGDEQRDKDDVAVFWDVTISIKKQKGRSHKPTRGGIREEEGERAGAPWLRWRGERRRKGEGAQPPGQILIKASLLPNANLRSVAVIQHARASSLRRAIKIGINTLTLLRNNPDPVAVGRPLSPLLSLLLKRPGMTILCFILQRSPGTFIGRRICDDDDDDRWPWPSYISFLYDADKFLRFKGRS